MSQRSSRQADEDRRAFIADPAVLEELGVSIGELGDPDVRAYVCRHEHPEFAKALEADHGKVDLGDGPINPRLHLSMHEVVAAQLWDDSPPEVWETAQRLLVAGYGRHEILHCSLARWWIRSGGALHDQQTYDLDRHVAALNALPGSWKETRPQSSPRRKDDPRKRARRAARAARRGNRPRR